MPAAGEIYNPWRTFCGSFIPNAILRCRELSSTAKLTFGRLSQYAGEDGEAYPSYHTLGQEIGVERRQAIRAVRELERFGLIRPVARHREDGGLTSNSYVFLWHAIFAIPGVINDTRGGVNNDTSSRCHERHLLVPSKSPKKIPTRETREKRSTTTTAEESRSLLAGTPFSTLTLEELEMLAKLNGCGRLVLAADIAAETWRRERKEIPNPGGYLRVLCNSLVVPAWYQSVDERREKAMETDLRKAAARKRLEEEKAEAERVERERETNWCALCDSEKEFYIATAKASIGKSLGILSDKTITAIAKTMAWDRRAGMITNKDAPLLVSP
jgi:hypothetical protein